MTNVDTLFVISSAKGQYVLDDMLSMINWSATGGSFFTVVVDQTAQLQQLNGPGSYQLLQTDIPSHSPAGFHHAAGLKWAIDQGITYRQVIMLSDATMVTTQQIDTFFKQYTLRDGIGLIGVRSSKTYENVWVDARTRLFQWRVPVAPWERPPVSLCDDFLILSPAFSTALHSKQLLLPPGAAEWPASYGCYLSWVCQMLGFYAVSWGFETKPLLPVYVSNSHLASLPPPQLFGNRLIVFAPIDKIMGYGEGDIRELYKQHRGERSRDVPRHQPVATGIEQSDVTLMLN